MPKKFKHLEETFSQTFRTKVEYMTKDTKKGGIY